MGAALHVVRWIRDHSEEARLLLLFRREDVAVRWPEELADVLATLDDGVQRALEDQARRRFGDDPEGPDRVTFALVDAPGAAARRHLQAGARIPPSADALVRSTCRCILGLPEQAITPAMT